jgi:hypothetical protein
MNIRTLAAAAIAASLMIPAVSAATVTNASHSGYALKTMKHHMTKHHACKHGFKLMHGKCYRTTVKK